MKFSKMVKISQNKPLVGAVVVDIVCVVGGVDFVAGAAKINFLFHKF